MEDTNVAHAFPYDATDVCVIVIGCLFHSSYSFPDKDTAKTDQWCTWKSNEMQLRTRAAGTACLFFDPGPPTPRNMGGTQLCTFSAGKSSIFDAEQESYGQTGSTNLTGFMYKSSQVQCNVLAPDLGLGDLGPPQLLLHFSRPQAHRYRACID